MSFSEVSSSSLDSYDKKQDINSFDQRIESNKYKASDPEIGNDFDTRVSGENPNLESHRNDVDDRIPIEKPLTYDEKVKLQDKEIADIEKHDLNSLDGQERGNYGEMKVDQDLRSKGYERISGEMVTSRRSELKPGLDGVYYKEGGEPAFIILDAKFGSARLNPETLDGKQMSEKWIDNRLDADVGKDMADKIRMEKLFNPDNVGAYVARVNTSSEVSYSKLDANANVVEGNCKL